MRGAGLGRRVNHLLSSRIHAPEYHASGIEGCPKCDGVHSHLDSFYRPVLVFLLWWLDEPIQVFS
jgi:hypothetical protein